MAAERYLAIETSSPKLSLAVGDAHKILAQYQGPLEWRHADTLFAGLQSLMKQVHWKPADLTGVAVSIGPGSFTGIRIGLSAARALGQAARIPVVGISSLQTIAWGLGSDVRWVSPVLDALQGRVFAALFERLPKGGLRVLLKERHVPVESWARTLRARKLHPLWLAGNVPNGIHTVLKKVPDTRWALTDQGYPSAASLLELTRPRLLHVRPDSYKHVFPLYLREAAVIERRKEARR